MKHFAVLLGLLLAGYGLWWGLGPQRRQRCLAWAGPHGLRLALGVLVLLAALVLAYQLPSIKLL